MICQHDLHEMCGMVKNTFNDFIYLMSVLFTPTVCKHKSVLFLEDGRLEAEMRPLSSHNVWA